MSDSIDTDKDGNPLTLSDIISDGRSLEEDTEQKLKTTKMMDLIRAMPEGRDKQIIVLRYGLNNQKPLTQREVAAVLGISRSYVSRIEKRVLAKLHVQLK